MVIRENYLPMSNLREEFRAFLLRVAENDLRPDDWFQFAVNHFPDEEVESLRAQLVRKSIELSRLPVDWIPRELSEFARLLSEYLRPAANATYWTESYELDDRDTLTIKTTWSDSESHSVGVSRFAVDHADYEFWRWVVAEKSRRTGLKRQRDIEYLRVEFQKTLSQ